MTIEIETNIFDQFNGKTEVTANEIVRFLEKLYPEAALKTLHWKIHELKKKGIIHHVSRGIYSFNKKKEYTPEISIQLKRLYNKLHKELPYLPICAWDNKWFNEFANHQMFKHFMVIETEKDATESVFNRLITPTGPFVFLDPDRITFEKYIGNHDTAIIVTPMVSESPTIQISGIVCASLEKLLVDCLANPIMFGAQQNELGTIFQGAMRYKVNINAMKRYARRRNKHNELEKQIQNIGKKRTIVPHI
jgi:hypothetical protein